MRIRDVVRWSGGRGMAAIAVSCLLLSGCGYSQKHDEAGKIQQEQEVPKSHLVQETQPASQTPVHKDVHPQAATGVGAPSPKDSASN